VAGSRFRRRVAEGRINRFCAGSRRCRAVVVAVVLLLALPIGALAYSRSGGSAKYNVYGWEYYCDTDGCYYWYGYAQGTTGWDAVFTHSEGTSEYDVAPFQQDALLHDGYYMWLDGVRPYAYRTANIYNNSGTRIYTNVANTSGTNCYAAAYGSYDLYWGGCDPYGFIISTSAYPPGTETSSVSMFDSGDVGGWYFSYSGALR
jgi:hypothetical protein